MFDTFKTRMINAVALDENKNKDGSINWNFVDADLYPWASVLLDSETYTEWFNNVADEIEGVEA